jgi:protein NirF
MKSLLSILAAVLLSACAAPALRGTGDLGVVVERAIGRLQLVETTGRTALATIDGLGDLSHASVVFSRDSRYAYVFGRDGGLTKVDLLCRVVVKRVVQAGNSIGGAISQDGRLVAVANYTPGGVKVFAADTLELVADIPATYGDGRRAKVVGLEDATGSRFVFSLFEAGEIASSTCRPARPSSRASRTSAANPTTPSSPRTAATTSQASSARTASRCSISGTPSAA